MSTSHGVFEREDGWIYGTYDNRVSPWTVYAGPFRTKGEADAAEDAAIESLKNQFFDDEWGETCPKCGRPTEDHTQAYSGHSWVGLITSDYNENDPDTKGCVVFVEKMTRAQAEQGWRTSPPPDPNADPF